MKIFALSSLAFIMLVSAVWVVALSNLFRAALSLGIVLLAVAGLFILLGAEFLGFAQILVYVGAILTLVIFAIMLTTNRLALPAEHISRHSPFAFLLCLGLFGVIVSVLDPLVRASAPVQDRVSTAALGQELVTRLVLPFELISLIFVAAMVGAIVVAVGAKPKAPDQ